MKEPERDQSESGGTEFRQRKQVGFGQAVGGEQPIDVADAHARIVERAPCGLSIQAEPGHVRDLADVGFAETDDRDCVAQAHLRPLHSPRMPRSRISRGTTKHFLRARDGRQKKSLP